MRTSGWLLCALVGGLVWDAVWCKNICNRTCPNCSLAVNISPKLPEDHNKTLQRLLSSIHELYNQYEKNVAKKKCENPLYQKPLSEVCLPAYSNGCADSSNNSACAIDQALKLAEDWMCDEGRDTLVCCMKKRRSLFEKYVIRNSTCPHINLNSTHANGAYQKKCVGLKILATLKLWLYEYVYEQEPPEFPRISYNSVL
ncbi:hypothetical protein AALO_G00069110 [Alosa alosa]|uniref:Uncharacterized protein n=1 Tax=Alosa alosa TaxID=278164 RepID=A0AAV6H1N0_9TELE|nr:hypothetical protein AALO_G00069110 [Alosa alosa]